ncbi:SUMO-specific isopeptidase USPL1 [Amia ocellicauda]|uniref:SUMO-specific isopeptidase USPL1 n=1 Tax=Amia ocellicauda TaxID=2972642 RepID=UPI003464C026
MVIFNKWLENATFKRSSSNLPMSGEGTGIGVSTPPMAGSLGKSQERFPLDKSCPVCAAKGQTQALRVYRISFQESIILCGNPQCIFPLGSKPLAEVLVPGTPGKVLPKRNWAKRKRLCTSLEKIQAELPSKCQRTEDPVSKEEDVSAGGEVQEPRSVDLSHQESSMVTLVTESENKEETTAPSQPEGVDVIEELAHTTDLCSLGKDTERPCSVQSNLDVKSGALQEADSGQLVPAPLCLFWKNRHSLCWLDSLMVALVHSSALKEGVNTLHTENSPVRKLWTEYHKACALLKGAPQTDNQEDANKIPSAVFLQAQTLLDDIRMFVFNLLQPMLRCKLGAKESPVFALPLLLKQDEPAEELFRHSFHWEFECSSCGHTLKNRCEKTLTTFTDIVPEWHPLNAVHRSQCNKCQQKLQQRRMVLERLHPIFMLHFVEGLPQNDLNAYAFDFQGKHYAVCTVIQYDESLKHFATWLRQDDGSWLECDDLKYPHCAVHKQLEVPAHEIHIVFWEAQEKSTEPETDLCLREDCVERDGCTKTDQQKISLLVPETDLFNVTSDVKSADLSADCSFNNSIGSDELLDTFEGLSHNDIVTLTLVEIKVETEGQALDRCQIPDSLEGSDQIEPPEEILPAQPSSENCLLGASGNGSLSPDMNHGIEMPSGLGRPEEPAKVCVSQPGMSKGSEAVLPGPLKTGKEKRGSVDYKRRVMAAVKSPPPLMVNSALSPDTTLPPSPSLALSGNITVAVSSTQSASVLSSAVSGIKTRASGGRWAANLLNRHPSLQASAAHLRHASGAPSSHSPGTLNKEKQGTKTPLALADDASFLGKAAEMFGGFMSKGRASTVVASSKGNLISQGMESKTQDVFKEECVKSPSLQATFLSKPVNTIGALHPTLGAATLGHDTPQEPSKTSALKGLDKSEKLRHKLLKKLKAKKEKLASLNNLLKLEGGGKGDVFRLPESRESSKYLDVKNVLPTPDSTDTESPYTVSSSTSFCSSPSYDEFFADLLSPATTTSSASPDSTGLLEMLVNGQETGGLPNGAAVDHSGSQGGTAVQPQVIGSVTIQENGLISAKEDFFSELMSSSTLAESTDFNMLDLSTFSFD